MNAYKSEYDAFSMYVGNFMEGATGYVHVYDEEDRWYEGVIRSVREIPGGNADFECEFITDDDTYYVGLDIMKRLKKKPDIKVTHYC